MATKKLKEYIVTRRIAVWMEAPIKAESLAQAVELAREMPDSDFITVPDGVEFCDSERLPGDGVREKW